MPASLERDGGGTARADGGDDSWLPHILPTSQPDGTHARAAYDDPMDDRGSNMPPIAPWKAQVCDAHKVRVTKGKAPQLHGTALSQAARKSRMDHVQQDALAMGL